MWLFILFITELIFLFISTIKVKLIVRGDIWTNTGLTFFSTFVVGWSFWAIKQTDSPLAPLVMAFGCSLGCFFGMLVVKKIGK